MTLKEKFLELAFERIPSEDLSIKCEKTADDYAIEFAKWCFNVVSEKKHKGIDTTKELLEIFKKEKGL